MAEPPRPVAPQGRQPSDAPPQGRQPSDAPPQGRQPSNAPPQGRAPPAEPPGRRPALAVATEGYLDLALIRRLLRATGFAMGEVLWGEGRQTGKGGLSLRLPRYAEAARRGAAVFVLRDLDDDAPCAPNLLRGLKVETGGAFCLRIAVREAEAWLMADREGLARYLRLPPGLLPEDPEALADPKAALVAAARRSRSRPIREGFTARPGAGRPEGPDFVEHVERFTRLHWRPETAADRSDSLARALIRLAELRDRMR